MQWRTSLNTELLVEPRNNAMTDSLRSMALVLGPCATKCCAVRSWVCLALSAMLVILICAQLTADLSTRSKFRWFQLSRAALQHPGFSNSSQHQWPHRSLNLLPSSAACAGNQKRTRIRSQYRNETEMLLAARNQAAASNNTLDVNTARIAFLFLVRGPIPHESLWRRFFSSDEDLYSIYVHAKPGFEFPPKSFFHCKEIPSKPVSRFAFNMVDAMRRLLAHALLDSAQNQWFVFVCESSIPVRSFRYVYDYLMDSNVSFVEAFKPPPSYYCWNTLPEFPGKKLRKGELWMAMLRRHAAMVVAESKLYRKFKQKCKRSVRTCTPDEEYIQTLLSVVDPTRIAKKTIMYVNWSGGNVVLGSPFSHSKQHISSRLIRKIQNRTGSSPVLVNCNSQSAPTNLSAMHQSCVKIVQVRRPSFLFARKFPKDSAAPLLKLPPSVLGF